MPTRQREKQRKMKKYRERSPSAAALKRMDPGSAMRAEELARWDSDYKRQMKQLDKLNRAALKRMDPGSAGRRAELWGGSSSAPNTDIGKLLSDYKRQMKRMDSGSAVRAGENKGRGKNSGR